MVYVYKFHIELVGLEKKMWRDMEVSSNYTVAQLGYANMASYCGKACHLFNIKFRDKRYEILFEPDDLEDMLGPAIDPTKVKLASLDMHIGETMTMEYDYGAGWEWTIRLVGISEMKKGTGKHYPYVIDGAGRGILEDTSVHELTGVIEKIDETGKPIEYFDLEDGKLRWDYRVCYPMEYDSLFKWDVKRIQEAYETPIEE